MGVESTDRLGSVGQAIESRVEIVRDEPSWLRLEGEWRQLCDEVRPSSGYCLWPWVKGWWLRFGRQCPVTGASGSPFVVVVRVGEKLVAIVPFLVQTPRQFWKPRRLRPMGYHREPDLHSLTEVPVMVIAPGFESMVWEQTMEALRGALREGLCDGFLFQHEASLVETVPVAEGMNRGICEWSKTKPGPLWVRLPESWAAYRKQVTRSMRDNLSYYPRLLDRGGHVWSIQKATSGPELTHAIDELIRLHRLRASSDPSASHEDYFAHSTQRDLLHQGLTELAGEGAAFVSTLVVASEVVAAQAFLISGNTLTVLYSGFDPEWGKFSPLLVIQGKVFRDALESGIGTIDFLQGRAAWQLRWSGRAEINIIKRMAIRVRPMSIVRGVIYLIRREIVKRRSTPHPAAKD